MVRIVKDVSLTTLGNFVLVYDRLSGLVELGVMKHRWWGVGIGLMKPIASKLQSQVFVIEDLAVNKLKNK